MPMSERTPLLKPATWQDIKPAARKLPYGQLAILCYARMMDLWFFFSIFPYVAQMIEELGVPQSSIGFYSGLIESVYSATNCFFLLFFWTGISDRFGRKPVLVVCLAGITVAGTLFGFSTSIWQMILFRALAGVFSGCIGTIRVMLGEITTVENRARAFSIWAFAGNAGVLMAPVIGGLLARPTGLLNFALLNSSVMRAFPYLLPSLVMGGLGVIGVVVCVLYLEETLPWDKQASQDVHIPSTREFIAKRGVLLVLINSLCANSMIYAWTAVQPIFSHTSVSLGGLGMTVQQISLVMAGVAIFQAAASLVIFPALHRRLGTASTLLFCGVCFFITFQISPLANVFARLRWTKAVWMVILASCITAALQTMASTTTQLAVYDIAPSPMALGKVNSIALAGNQAARTIAPSISGSLFALGVDRDLLNGHLAWYILSVVAVLYCVSMAWYPKKPKTADSQKGQSA